MRAPAHAPAHEFGLGQDPGPAVEQLHHVSAGIDLRCQMLEHPSLRRSISRAKASAAPARTTARYKVGAEPPSTMYAASVHGAPAKPINAVSDGRLCRTCRMAAYTGARCSRSRAGRSCSIAATLPHRLELGPAPSSKRAAAQRVRHHQDVGEQNRGIETIAVNGLHGGFRRELGRIAELEKVSRLAAQTIFGQVAASLPHQPDRWALGSFSVFNSNIAGSSSQSARDFILPSPNHILRNLSEGS